MKQTTWEDIIKKTMPAVVTIVISKSLEDIEKHMPQELLPFFPFNTPKLNLPPEAIDAHGMVKIGSGSGFIVDQKGIILTNKHVVADKDADYLVITNDNQKYKVDVLACDPIDDVAILKISKPLTATESILGDSEKLVLGQPILAIGNALGLFKNTVSSGIVSGLSRSIAAGGGEPNNQIKEMRGLIQTDAAINPGNSGGPLLNLSGEVVGINTAIVFGAQNLSFAIPINSAKKDLQDLKEFGRIKRPLVGLRFINIDDDLKEKLKLPVNYGALVMSQGQQHTAVIHDSPADKAGIKEKDIILECNGKKVTVEENLQDHLENLSAGDYVTFKIRRNSREFNVQATLSERR